MEKKDNLLHKVLYVASFWASYEHSPIMSEAFLRWLFTYTGPVSQLNLNLHILGEKMLFKWSY